MRLFGRSDPFESLSASDTHDALAASGGTLVDVRETHEFAAGHAVGAKNIPLGQLANRAGELTLDGPIYVICASGNRSKLGATLLARAGAAQAVNVEGGTMAWMRAGLPLER